MVKVTLKGGAVKEYDDNVTVAEIAKSLGGGLYKAACAGKLNGRVVDLRTPITEDSEVELLTFDSQEGKRAYYGPGGRPAVPGCGVRHRPVY